MKSRNYINYLHKEVRIKWHDSYGVDAGWKDISDYLANELVVTSWGKVIYEDDKTIALVHNYAEETNNTCLQANGIMVISRLCIIEITDINKGNENDKNRRSIYL